MLTTVLYQDGVYLCGRERWKNCVVSLASRNVVAHSYLLPSFAGGRACKKGLGAGAIKKKGKRERRKPGLKKKNI